MIKEIKTHEEVITQHKYCDICGAEIKHRLACMDATCEYCRKDLCEKCIGYEEGTDGDYREVWCDVCWQMGSEYRPEIEECEAKIHQLYQEWQNRCMK